MALALAPDTTRDRTPPHDVGAEKAVLASVLIKPTVFGRVALDLRVDEFFMPAHREIFDAMLELDRRRQPIDPVMLCSVLKSNGGMKHLEGGELYVMQLDTPSAENLDAHVEVIQEKARLRGLIKIAGEALSSAYAEADSASVIEDLSNKTLGIITRRKTDLHHVGKELQPLLEDFEARKLRRENGDENAGITGVRTGITKFDRLTTGLQPGDLIIVAGGTSTGKTAFANQVCLNLCLEGGTALEFNLEMRKRQLVERSFVHLAEVNSALLREGRIDKEDFKRLQGAAGKLFDSSLFIHDDCSTDRDIFGTARRWRTLHPKKKGLMVVDFIQLVRMASSGAFAKENRARMIGLFTQGLKELAKELEIPIIAVSQLNRVGMKSDVRPTKYDLKESGDIENAADVILILHNPEETGDGEIDGYVDKNRNGECKRFKTHWRGRYYQFSDPSNDTPEPQQKDMRYGD